MTATQEQLGRLAEAIKQFWFDRERKKNRRISQNELSKHFGVNPTSLSYWLDGLREPSDNNKHKLAIGGIGPVVYDIFEQPRRMPKEDDFNEFADLYYDEYIVDDDIHEALNLLRQRREERKKAQPNLA
jgi:transcriptional regulator with XRE-family HTH domain